MRTRFARFTAIGAVLLAAGCGGQGAVDTSRLPPPVNAAQPVVAAESAQVAAADALGRIGEPAVAALSAALGDSNPVVRFQACRALAYMGTKAQPAVPALTHALSDPEDSVRQQAAMALGQIGEPASPAVPVLMEMLRGRK